MVVTCKTKTRVKICYRTLSPVSSTVLHDKKSNEGPAAQKFSKGRFCTMRLPYDLYII